MAQVVPSAYRYDPETGINHSNQGIIDIEKGHILALQLGGPDIPENIVPQWAKWQGCGEWSQMEKRIRKLAEDGLSRKKNQYHVLFHCSVGYLNIAPLKTGSDKGALLKRLCVPNHYTVKVTKVDMKTGKPFEEMVMYDDSPQRSDVDDQLFLRIAFQVEKRSLGKHWEPYGDWRQKMVRNKKGEVRDASGFVKGGQDPQYNPKIASATATGGGKRRSDSQESGPPITYSVTAEGSEDTPAARFAKRARLNDQQAALAAALAHMDDDQDSDFVPSDESSESSGEESGSERRDDEMEIDPH
ncbi:MAG TPA: hypothetical protein VGM18_06805 [Candidatus Sulfotelmatobacter sp.]|jgi:hypothetical protein